jgi:hypothetical protein
MRRCARLTKSFRKKSRVEDHLPVPSPPNRLEAGMMDTEIVRMLEGVDIAEATVEEADGEAMVDDGDGLSVVLFFFGTQKHVDGVLELRYLSRLLESAKDRLA